MIISHSQKPHCQCSKERITIVIDLLAIYLQLIQRIRL